MKALVHIRFYGERPMVSFGYGYGRHVHFADPQPENGTIVCVEIPEVEHPTTAAVIEWLSAGKSTSRREIFELPSEVWRPAVLDDFIDADHYRQCVWLISQHFSAEAIDAFVEKWLPVARAEAREALAVENEHARAMALKAIMDRMQRIYAVVGNVPGQLNRQMSTTFERVEQARLSALRVTNPPPEAWIEAAGEMQSNVVRNTLIMMAEKLRDERAKPERVAQLLETIRTTPLRDVVPYDSAFWAPLEPMLDLSPNVSGEEIDITDAREEIVGLGWQLYEGRRIGQIVPARTALVIRTSTTATYIRGERKLKFRVVRAGGRLEALGNTFVVREQSDAIGAALLEVDRLDTLAQIHPRQALQALETLDLAADHPVFEAARAAETDPRQGRVLADLLIELVVGIDADIARGMARAQARGNRR